MHATSTIILAPTLVLLLALLFSVLSQQAGVPLSPIISGISIPQASSHSQRNLGRKISAGDRPGHFAEWPAGNIVESHLVWTCGAVIATFVDDGSLLYCPGTTSCVKRNLLRLCELRLEQQVSISSLVVESSFQGYPNCMPKHHLLVRHKG